MEPIAEPIKILVLDDDPFINKMLTSMLIGYNVRCATTFNEFHTIIEEFIPDIAIIDLLLPDANGLDVCKWIRNQSTYEDTILYILTSNNDEQTLIRAYSIGVMDYIIKPFNKFILFSKLHRCALMIEIKRRLEASLKYQKDLKKRLLQLNDFVKKCITIDDLDSLVALVVYVQHIVPVDGLYVFAANNNKYTPLELIPHQRSPKIISALHKAADISKNDSILFFFDNKNNIYVSRIALQQHGFVFLVKEEQFNPDEKNMLTLFAELLKVIISRTEIHDYVQKQNRIYQEEISRVRQIQVAQLPKFKNIHGFEIASTFLPAEDISGDFFDGFFINGNTDIFQIVLCDVSGHGVASSYIGNAIRALIRTYSKEKISPAQVLYKLNQQMAIDGKGLFYYGTIVIVRLYPDGKIVYASGGHPPLYYFNSGNQSIEEIHNTGPLVGIFHAMEFKDFILNMNSGDMLLLYTDGIIESMDPDLKKLYGDERLKNNIMAFSGEPVMDMLHSICGSMYEFTGYAPLEDDVTLICIKKI